MNNCSAVPHFTVTGGKKQHSFPLSKPKGRNNAWVDDLTYVHAATMAQLTPCCLSEQAFLKSNYTGELSTHMLKEREKGKERDSVFVCAGASVLPLHHRHLRHPNWSIAKGITHNVLFNMLVLSCDVNEPFSKRTRADLVPKSINNWRRKEARKVLVPQAHYCTVYHYSSLSPNTFLLTVVAVYIPLHRGNFSDIPQIQRCTQCEDVVL